MYILFADSFDDDIALPGIEGNFYQQHNGTSNHQRVTSNGHSRETVSMQYVTVGPFLPLLD